MDIATIAGIIVFLSLSVGSIYMSQGMDGFKPFKNPEALMMVMGGTLCATLVNYPLSQVIGVGKVIPR